VERFNKLAKRGQSFDDLAIQELNLSSVDASDFRRYLENLVVIVVV
jgi:hypothetical protein